MRIDAPFAIAVGPMQGDHIPLAVRRDAPVRVEPDVKPHESLGIGPFAKTETLPAGKSQLQLDLEAGDLVRDELRDHRADGAQSSARLETGLLRA